MTTGRHFNMPTRSRDNSGFENYIVLIKNVEEQLPYLLPTENCNFKHSPLLAFLHMNKQIILMSKLKFKKIFSKLDFSNVNES